MLIAALLAVAHAEIPPFEPCAAAEAWTASWQDCHLWFAFVDGGSIWLDGVEVSRSVRVGTPILEDTIVDARRALPPLR